MARGNQMITWTMTSRSSSSSLLIKCDPEMSNSWRLEPKISKTAANGDSVPNDYQYEMAYGVSNNHVADDVVWPWKVL